MGVNNRHRASVIVSPTRGRGFPSVGDQSNAVNNVVAASVMHAASRRTAPYTSVDSVVERCRLVDSVAQASGYSCGEPSRW